MLEKILKLYTMAMAGDVRSPVPHLYGPPGCGKSTSVEQAARLIAQEKGSCFLHIINVSRLSPLEVEGVQMPHGSAEDMVLKMLPATYWNTLEEGDIILFDEFLRGFPEVYNGLLDVFTARRVGAHVLPRVFIIAASNSTVTYDGALEDRLLHLPVDDPRTDMKAQRFLKQLFVDQLGLFPDMLESDEMQSLIDLEVLPMYTMLDSLKTKSSGGSSEGHSPRNLIGQAQLREIQSIPLRELIEWNNRRAITAGKYQYVLLPEAKNVDKKYAANAGALPKDKLTPVQALNLELNMQLIALEQMRVQKGTPDDPFINGASV